MGRHLSMGSHSVICHPTEVTFTFAFTPTGQVGTRFIDPVRMKGWVGLVGWLHTEMVYPSAEVSHPGTNWIWRSATTLIEANALPLSQTANRGNKRPATASACAVCHCKRDNFPAGRLLNNVSKTLIVKSQTVIDCLQLSDTDTCDDGKITSFSKLVHCIFVLWVNTQNFTGWKWWVLVEKLMPLMKN